MTELDERIENGLNETRMLLLGSQVLLGFAYRVCFEPAFYKIAFPAQISQVIGIAIMTAGLGWLVWPAPFHQIVERGQGTRAIERFTTRVLDWGLLPFALGLGLSLYPVATAIRPGRPLTVALAGTIFALLIWYGWTLMSRDPERLRRSGKHGLLKSFPGEHRNQSDLGSRIKFVLIECRMALPGAQAFLGFQFAIVFTEVFGELSRPLQWIHFASLLATTIAIVLLIAPAAYHRLAEGGENSEHFHRVAGRLLVVSLVFLGPGMAGDLLLVVYILSLSPLLSACIAVLMLLAFYGLWFGVSAARRLQQRKLVEAA
jgi:hypothetical protein